MIMSSGFYLFFILASCFIVIPTYASIIDDDRYIPINELDTNVEQKRDQNDEQTFISQRAAHFILPPTAFISAASRSSEHLDLVPTQRQTFGRKHHWDAFFGRRR